MATIVTRSGKGSALTHNEVDANFNNLNNDKIELTSGNLLLGGNVGIGTSSPSATLAVETGGIASLSSYAGHIVVGPSSRTSSSGDYSGGILFDQANGVQASGKKGASITGLQDGSDVNSMGITFNVHGTDGNANREEAMRIDSSGNLLVGKTTLGISTNGFDVRPTGETGISVDSNIALDLNRTTNDGKLINLRKDDTTVGSINVGGGNVLAIGQGSNYIQFHNSLNSFYASDGSGGRDNAMDIGASGVRFKDLYLSGGVFLGGTGAANKLTDYEVGTFTPQFRGTGNNPTVSYNSSNKGSYIKIGRMVQFVISLSVVSYSGGSGTARVTLPFTVQGGGDYSQNYIPFPTAQWGAQINPTRTNLLGRGEAGNADMIFRSDDNNGSVDEQLSIFPTSGFFIRITGCYTATT